MPVYEYRCAACRKKTSLFVRSSSQSAYPVCSHCGAAQLTRLFSTFAVRRGASRNASEAGDGDMGDMDGMAESDMAGLDEGDPRAMARMMRRMSAESGEPMDDETTSMISRMESGEMPDDPMDGGDGAGGMGPGPGMGDED